MRSKTSNIGWLVVSTYIIFSAFGCGGGGGGGGPAQPITGPGDTGNYFPLTQGNTGKYMGNTSNHFRNRIDNGQLSKYYKDHWD